VKTWGGDLEKEEKKQKQKPARRGVPRIGSVVKREAEVGSVIEEGERGAVKTSLGAVKTSLTVRIRVRC
jgi:hypothetical protein